MLGGKVLPKSMHVALCTHREMNSMQNSTARHTKWVLDKCCICIIDKKPSSLPLLYHILLGCLEFFLSSIVAEFASFLWDFIDYNKRKQKKADCSTKIVCHWVFLLSEHRLCMASSQVLSFKAKTPHSGNSTSFKTQNTISFRFQDPAAKMSRSNLR